MLKRGAAVEFNGASQLGNEEDRAYAIASMRGYIDTKPEQTKLFEELITPFSSRILGHWFSTPAVASVT
jgi:hypothetical protein